MSLVMTWALKTDAHMRENCESIDADSRHLSWTQLQPKLRTETMQCVTFATPPVVTRDVAIACEDYVTTVVHQVTCADPQLWISRCKPSVAACCAAESEI